ncbi:hypothetical protein SAMN04487948_104121 [Halogranum amylolyticum]|uniref:Uncharacterized protein n=1 Tax=Halogranum amylolyticum TaxID=660520 RepID=A0A1H8RMV8_9EURY|nr:hypothetical protein SAMN04487948_104121 [Halogranum amylolyticum]
MLGSGNQNDSLSSCEWYGTQVECELCGEVRTCTERCSMVTCRECQADLLPPTRG